MAAAGPGAIPTASVIPSGGTQDVSYNSRTHPQSHNDLWAEVVALWTKAGTGASTATANTVYAGTGTGTTGYTSTPTVTDLTTTGKIVPAAVAGTPAQHALYRDNVVKGWAKVTVSGGTPSIAASFNVSSITDTGVGALTVTWDRDFASVNYAITASVQTGLVLAVMIDNAAAPTVTATQLDCYNLSLAGTDPNAWNVIAIGAQ